MIPTDPTDKQEIYSWLVNILNEMFELDKARITLEANLYSDLDIDSIDAVDLAVKLKQLTGKRLEPEVFKSVRTVQDIVDALSGLLHKKQRVSRPDHLRRAHRSDLSIGRMARRGTGGTTPDGRAFGAGRAYPMAPTVLRLRVPLVAGRDIDISDRGHLGERFAATETLSGAGERSSAGDVHI